MEKFLGGLILGIGIGAFLIMCISVSKDTLIEKGVMEYHSTTGEIEWVEPKENKSEFSK